MPTHLLRHPLLPFGWSSRRQETILSSSKTTCDTNRRRVKIVRHVPTVVLRPLKKHEIPPHPTHTRVKNAFFKCWKLHMDLQAAGTREGDMSNMPSVQPTKQPRTSPPGSRGSEHMPRHPSCGCLPECSVSRAMARLVLSKLKKLSKLESTRIGPAWAVNY